MEKAFEEFIKDYDLSNSDIKLKYNHSYRVQDLQVKYARLLGFSEDDIEIARLIGLLHDVGRFEQLKYYDTYNDYVSMDHAECGVQLLFDKGLIKEFCDREEWYPIIKFAILNHNKFFIEDCDDERMLKHAKLIRDTDKIDILYLMGTLKEIIREYDETKLSDEVLKYFANHTSVYDKDVKSKNDHHAILFSFPLDINYDVVLEEVKKNYIPFYEEIKGHEDFERIYYEVLKYIDERVSKSERIRKKI